MITMSRLPIVSGAQIVKALFKLGYRKVRQRGSHIRLYARGKKSITVPDHKTIGRGLLRKIIRDAQISVSEFFKLLK